jgi:hypothetical protein
MNYWWDKNRQEIGTDHIQYELGMLKAARKNYNDALKKQRDGDETWNYLKCVFLESFWLHFDNIDQSQILQPFYDKKGFQMIEIREKVQNQIVTLSKKRTSDFDIKLNDKDIEFAYEWLEFACRDDIEFDFGLEEEVEEEVDDL